MTDAGINYEEAQMKRRIKKLALLAASVALVAIALPAMASAQIWEEGTPDKLLPVASELSAEGHFEIENGMLGTWGCNEVSFDAEVTQNKPESARFAGLNGSAKNCPAGPGNTIVEEFTIVEANTTKPGEGEIILGFHWLISPFNCGYQGIGTFTYEPGTNIINLNVPIESWTSEMCEPEEGESVMHGQFTLHTKSGAKALLYEAEETPPSWSIQSTPGSFYGQLNDVSCASASECVAVGYKNESGWKALAERWNGKEWTTTAAPGGERLNEVSCVSSSFCMAIPDGLEAQRWNGSKWSAMTMATPSEATYIHVGGVSCTNSSSIACIAVGHYTLPNGKIHALAERYEGEKWTILTTPTEEGTSLGIVSCAAGTDCVAIGEKGGKAVALRWTITGAGGEWSTMAAPKHVGYDISCGWGCVMVGPSGGESWNGTEWTAAAIPLPEDAAYGGPEAVSCSGGECIATGYYVVESENREISYALAERWDGSEWVIQEGVHPGEEEAVLSGVSCTSPGNCTAVGIGGTLGNYGPLAERYE